MPRLAAMRRAGEGKLRVAETVAIGRAALDQGKRLKGLNRRTREDRLLHVAYGGSPPAARVDHDDGAVVPTFDDQAAGDFDEDGVDDGKIPSRRARSLRSVSNPIQTTIKRNPIGSGAIVGARTR